MLFSTEDELRSSVVVLVHELVNEPVDELAVEQLEELLIGDSGMDVTSDSCISEGARLISVVDAVCVEIQLVAECSSDVIDSLPETEVDV